MQIDIIPPQHADIEFVYSINGKGLTFEWLLTALMLRFEAVPYSRWRNAGLLTFSHQTSYVRFEPVNNAIINFNKYCHWCGFCGEVGRDMFRDEVCSVERAFRLLTRLFCRFYIFTCIYNEFENYLCWCLDYINKENSRTRKL
jgi:hypothetical protein